MGGAEGQGCKPAVRDVLRAGCRPIGRAVAVIDGEHYPSVVVDALAQVAAEHTVVCALLVGGTEKIEAPSASDYGVELEVAGADPAISLGEVVARYGADTVVDLSDEPAVGYRERFRLASYALAAQARYVGAGFAFEPPRQVRAARRPSIAIIGTGKRVGKTAVSAHLARRLKERRILPVVVAMGRGGPAEPELIRGDQVQLSVEELIMRARGGAHAASDYFEDAVMSRVPTVGSRRCGGGLAGEPYVDTVLEGAAVANEVDDARIHIYEGSGAALPPVRADATMLVASARQPSEHVAGLFGTYRLLRSDVLVVTMCEPGVAERSAQSLADEVRRERKDLPIIYTVFRPKPLSSVHGRRVFFATTAEPAMLDALTGYLQAECGCEIVAASPHLSDRAALRADIERAGRFDVLVTELKAAAVDVAAREARRRDAEVVLMDNEPVDAGEPGALSRALDELADTALERYSLSA